jgi:hypothetical protein
MLGLESLFCMWCHVIWYIGVNISLIWLPWFWRWRQQLPLKHWYQHTRLHGITSKALGIVWENLCSVCRSWWIFEAHSSWYNYKFTAHLHFLPEGQTLLVMAGEWAKGRCVLGSSVAWEVWALSPVVLTRCIFWAFCVDFQGKEHNTY